MSICGAAVHAAHLWHHIDLFTPSSAHAEWEAGGLVHFNLSRRVHHCQVPVLNTQAAEYALKLNISNTLVSVKPSLEKEHA